MDAWTSPNHKPYVAITVHRLQDGVPSSMLLDIIKLSERHAGANLAQAVVTVLKEFGIDKKVSVLYYDINTIVDLPPL